MLINLFCKHTPARLKTAAQTLPSGVRSLSFYKKSRLNRRFFYGGAKGDRTPDLLIANQSLSQLSYSPSILALTRSNAIKTLCVILN